MFKSTRNLRSGLAVATVSLVAAWVMVAQQPRQVNDALLKTGSKTGDEWVAYGTKWSEQRYSPLKEINDSNVSRLGVAWTVDIPYATPGGRGAELHQEATPLVFNNTLYSITPWSVVYAVDLKTHEEKWRNDPKVDQSIWQSRICCGVVNRGIAMYEGKIIAPIVDGRLRALDAATGKELWVSRVSPENQAYTITMAPRVIKGGKIIVGVSGGEFAVRGFFSAFDVNTGKELWKFYTVPGDPSKPFEQPELKEAAKTWTNDWWKLGGGAGVWNGLAYDDENDLVYVGTGQPGPWTDYHRGPGDNLFSCSILAVHASTGKLAWYYQEVPGDDWDYDSIADLMLADLTINGKQRKVIMHSPKDAFFYVLDRVTGEVISADPITKVSWATGIDEKGHPIVNPGARYKTQSVTVNPGPSGGHVWPPWSYNPGTGLVYIPGNAGQGAGYQAAETFTPVSTDIGPTGQGKTQMGTGGAFGGGGRGRGGNQGKGAPPVADLTPEQQAVQAQQAAAAAAAAAANRPEPLKTWGPDGPTGQVLYAWDPIARKEKWRAPDAGAGPFAGGTLTTAGNIVTSSVNRNLLVFNATTGALLLTLDLNTNQLGPAITFTMDGKQYIAVAGAPAAAGGGGRGGPGGAPGGPGGGRGGPGGPGGPAPGGPPAATAAVTPAHMFILALDGKAPIPGAPVPAN